MRSLNEQYIKFTLHGCIFFSIPKEKKIFESHFMDSKDTILTLSSKHPLIISYLVFIFVYNLQPCRLVWSKVMGFSTKNDVGEVK